jgi:putative transposase
MGRRLSCRRACRLLGVPRSTMDYVPQRGRADGRLLAELRRLATRHPRYGYRRIWALLRRAGYRVNVKRIYRLWRRSGLTLPRRRPRRKLRTGARVNPLAAGPNAVWTYDFVHDWAARGGQFKCLSVVDEYTKECLALVAARSLPAAEVLRVLRQLVARYGAPRYLRSDNGPEFIARRVRRWLAQGGSRPPTSIRASRGRTAWGRASTAGCGTSAWIGSGFTRSLKRACCWNSTGAPTTSSGPTPVSAIAPRQRSGNTVPRSLPTYFPSTV